MFTNETWQLAQFVDKGYNDNVILYPDPNKYQLHDIYITDSLSL